jgi:lipid-A-disaccharide synthase
MRNRVLIIAGEASGDLHGANLVKAIRAVDPSIIFRGVGSKHMLEAGVGLLWDAAEMAVVGLPGVDRLATIFNVFRMVSSILHRWQPDLVILIDYPEFNLLIAGKAKKLGIPVMYYISPQIWAWRSGRINTIQRRVDRMVVILPFEEKIYREAGVEASFVGHPLLDVVSVKDKDELPRSQYVRSGNDRLVGLLPGSRYSELSRLMPVMLDAATILAKNLPEIRFLMPLAPTIRPDQVDPYLREVDLPLTVVEHSTYEIIQMCEIIVAASGTVTLEAAILGTPLVVVYKVNPLTYWIGKRLVRVKHVALVNLVTSQAFVPELIQHDASPERISQEVLDILGDTRRQEWMRQCLRDVRQRLGSPGASARAAAIALELMGKSYSAGLHETDIRFKTSEERISLR